jgi:LAO/AO transport system kinase
MISMGQDRGWSPPVIETVATRGTGIVELATAIADHRAHLESAGEREGRRRMAAARQLAAAIRLEADRTSEVNDLDDLVTQVATRQIDPWTAAARLLATG